LRLALALEAATAEPCVEAFLVLEVSRRVCRQFPWVSEPRVVVCLSRRRRRRRVVVGEESGIRGVKNQNRRRRRCRRRRRGRLVGLALRFSHLIDVTGRGPARGVRLHSRARARE
jgi:hypothetical protein